MHLTGKLSTLNNDHYNILAQRNWLCDITPAITELGYQPVTFADLTDDEAFWRGCEGCVNVDVLKRTGRKYCICTGMLFDPEEHLPAKIPNEVLARIRRLEGKEEENNNK